MAQSREWTYDGRHGKLVARTWRGPDSPTHVVVVAHGYGEHVGRYELLAARYAQRYRGTLAALVLSSPVIGRWDAVPQLLALDEIPDIPLDITTLSRDPAVGETYAADPLVWHGPFKRATLEALQRGLETIAA